MFIKKLFIVLVMLIAGVECLHAQQAITDPAGKWEIIRVDARWYTQDTDSLLRISTLTTAGDIRRIHAVVPMSISLDQSHCVLTMVGAQDEGSYKLEKGGKLLYRSTAMAAQVNAQAGKPMQELPPVVYEYRLKEDGTLVLELPASYYKDKQSGLAVMLACTCYYRKQK